MYRILKLKNGNFLRVDILTEAIFRIRLNIEKSFPESGLNRYGTLREKWPEIDPQISENQEQINLTTEQAALSFALNDGRMVFKNKDNKVILEETVPPFSRHDNGFKTTFKLEDDRLYGMGDNGRENIQRRGHKYNVVMRNVKCYIPIPFLMSSNGWAILMNSTWYHEVDAGATEPGLLKYTAQKGDLDYYLIAGSNLPDLLDKYTSISGRPALLPRWAYSLNWICDEREVRARDVLYEALEFRRQGIPCDLIGLEPGWMGERYDFSIEKDWDQKRFHIPFWLKGKDHGTFAASLKKMGFKLSLWLCNDYDLSAYEEELLNKQNKTGSEEAENNEDDLIKDPHFKPRHFDNITKQGEPWFEHLKKFIDDGARAFKLDAASMICPHPDRRWSNGMDDEEMHNLYPILYNKQMTKGYREYTGLRPMVNSADGYAGIQKYSASWAGDTGGGPKPLTSVLNHALSGHSNTSSDMETHSEQSIHFGFLQPWTQINGWHQYNQPWFQGEKILKLFKFYAHFRYQLLPYIYSLARTAHESGLPIARPMPLAFPNDPKSDELILQYMLGDAFLTGAFSETVYLPEGEWFDYWTDKKYIGPVDLKAEWPENRSGILFVKSGAIIPMAPPMNYSDEKPLETVILDIYPSENSTSFTLYEDDGETFAMEDGEFTKTEISQQLDGEKLQIGISPRKGSYKGMPETRNYKLIINSDKPKELIINEKPVNQDEIDKHYDVENKQLKMLFPQ